MGTIFIFFLSLSLVSPLFLLTLNRKNKRKCLPVSLYVAGRAHNWNFRHLQMAAPKGTHPLLPSANGETEFFSHFFFSSSSIFQMFFIWEREREREKRRRKEGEQSATHREMAVGGGDVGTRRRSVAVWTVRAFRPALGHSRRSHFPSVQWRRIPQKEQQETATNVSIMNNNRHHIKRWRKSLVLLLVIFVVLFFFWFVVFVIRLAQSAQCKKWSTSTLSFRISKTIRKQTNKQTHFGFRVHNPVDFCVAVKKNWKIKFHRNRRRHDETRDKIAASKWSKQVNSKWIDFQIIDMTFLCNICVSVLFLRVKKFLLFKKKKWKKKEAEL